MSPILYESNLERQIQLADARQIGGIISYRAPPSIRLNYDLVHDSAQLIDLAGACTAAPAESGKGDERFVESVDDEPMDGAEELDDAACGALTIPSFPQGSAFGRRQSTLDSGYRLHTASLTALAGGVKDHA
jgi:hypothetical protein